MDWIGKNQIFINYMLPDVAPSMASGSGSARLLASIVIRPVQPNDVELIMEMHQRLSSDSLYRRYHGPRIPPRPEIEQICRLDGENGRAVVAATYDQKPAVVGIAYYVVSGQGVADTAFLVEDGYQGLGIGKRLMQQLSNLAQAQGICFFDAHVLPSNRPMIRLLRHSGQLVQNVSSYGARDMRVQLC